MTQNDTNQTTVNVVEQPNVDDQNSSAPRNNDRRFSKPRRDNKNNRRPRADQKQEFEERVVTIRRVTKVTKGGRHFRFAAVVVVGNKKGQVGFGTGKANEVPDAIKKAVKEAHKHLIRVPLRGTTIPHEVLGNFGAGKVLIKPAKAGTGVIAGGPARAVIELAGIGDIYAKSLGSNSPINMIRATIAGLENIQTRNQVQALRFSKEVQVNQIKVDEKEQQEN